MTIKARYIFFFFSLVLILLFMFSCKTTKFVPEGSFLLKEVKVNSSDKNINKEEALTYVTQKPNFKTFQLFQLPLFLYNLAGTDSTKWINRTLKNAGEKPVLYDSIQMEKTMVSLTRLAFNKGYLDAKVTTDFKYKGKTLQLTYNIDTKEPYRIDSFSITLPDSVFVKPDSLIIKDVKFPSRKVNLGSIDEEIKKLSSIKPGDQFDLDVINQERTKITNFLRRCGYYSFSQEFLAFEVDTILPDNKVNISTVFYPLAIREKDGNIKYEKHKQYIVNKVNFNLDYDPYNFVNMDDSIAIIKKKEGYNINYGDMGVYLRPHILLRKTYIQPNELYNELLTEETYSGLAQLNILKNVNIAYQLRDGELICNITAIPQKKQEVSWVLEGSNSGGFFGMGTGATYKHRNIFKRSEEFSIGVKGEYEMVTPNFAKFDDNYFEIGLEAGMKIPRFMLPFLSKDFRRSSNAISQLTSAYSFQRRPGYFSRTVFSTALTYKWNNRLNRNMRHKLNLIEANYVHVPELDSIFAEGLSVGARKYSFSDQFIIGAGYSFSKTNFNNATKWTQPVYNFLASVESAGNALYLISEIAKFKKNEDGEREIFGAKFAQFLRGTIDYSRTVILDDHNIFAWHAGFGIAYPYGNFKEVPIQKRFFAGGANNLRGWAVRTLGPGSFRPISNTKEYNNFFYHSGDLLLDFNMEYRSKLIWIIEMALFMDFGNIWTLNDEANRPGGQFKFDKFYKEIAASWGLGVRFDFNYFLLRVDCGFKAYNPEKSGSEPEQQVNHWPIKNPFNFARNAALHVAVGYPF